MPGLFQKGDGELRGLLSQSRHKLQQFRFAAAGSKAKNVREGRQLRKTIARIMTELRARETPPPLRRQR